MAKGVVVIRDQRSDFADAVVRHAGQSRYSRPWRSNLKCGHRFVEAFEAQCAYRVHLELFAQPENWALSDQRFAELGFAAKPAPPVGAEKIEAAIVRAFERRDSSSQMNRSSS